MDQPLIGVTAFHTLNPEKGLRYLSVTKAYVQALIRAGAIPMLVPLGLSAGARSALVARLDGLVLTGGGDIEPARYGSPPHPLVTEIDPERDDTELHLARGAVDSGLPFLGICRGLQTLNVAQGGTLYADIGAEHPDALEHACFARAPRQHLAHPISIDPDSRLFSILGRQEVLVNSGHHQAVRALGEGLVITARAPDGIIEALETPDHPFGLAVQWHPEWLLDHGEMLALFRAFVRAAARHVPA